jgi:hypothetical protein
MKYVQTLSKGCVKDSTIINHLTYLHKWAIFIESYENMIIPKAFFATIKSTQKGMRKKRNRDMRRAEVENTEQTMVEKGCWPEGGIQQLREEVIR